MQITKREFINITMGGLTADSILEKVDFLARRGHIPSVSTVERATTLVENEADAFARFWTPEVQERMKHLIISPGILYCRFELSEKTATVAPRHEFSYVSTYSGKFYQGETQFTLAFVTSAFPPKENEWAFDYSNVPYGKLRMPEHFIGYGQSIILDRETSDHDVTLFERHGVVDVVIATRSYSKVPAMRMTARADIDRLVERGQPTNWIPEKMYRMDPPLVIEPGWPLMTPITYVTAGDRPACPTIKGYYMLDGYYARGVC